MPSRAWADLVTEAGDTDFKAIPPADYDMEIIKAEVKTSGSGKTMFAITCSITEGPHKGRRIWSNLVVSPDSPQALNIFFRQMAAIGIDKSYFGHNPSDHNVAETLVGRKFRGTVKVKQFQGNDKNEITGYARTSRSGSSASPVSPPTASASPSNTPPAPAGMPVGSAPAPSPTSSTKSAAVESTPEPERVTQPATPPVDDEPVSAVASSDGTEDTPPEPPF